MSPFVAGALLLVVLLILARGYTRTNARVLAKGMRFTGGMVLALLTVALGISGRIGFAFLTAGASWYLLFGSPPPWQGPYGTSGGRGRQEQGQGPRQSGSSSSPGRLSGMSRPEALSVLGLADGASEEQIRAAHRRLILQTHPDKGGTDYLAAKINEAKDVLLGRR